MTDAERLVEYARAFVHALDEHDDLGTRALIRDLANALEAQTWAADTLRRAVKAYLAPDKFRE